MRKPGAKGGVAGDVAAEERDQCQVSGAAGELKVRSGQFGSHLYVYIKLKGQ
ncbi:hypothetical protein [Bacillus sp. X2(2017)]|uniref:hypothetical protein n=1 Tax=Bacillus sp. X2(2017) TaxID=2025586 RepID=UPI0015962099|nr:hypothetical protein [Bacillus sp. X2(2017)]